MAQSWMVLRRSLVAHLAIGAAVAEVASVAFYLWLHHRYTVGVDPGFGLFLLVAIGLLGAVVGGVVFQMRRKFSVR